MNNHTNQSPWREFFYIWLNQRVKSSCIQQFKPISNYFVMCTLLCGRRSITKHPHGPP